jgi:hypothetical protein
VEKRREKERQNDNYGAMLKKQVDEIHFQKVTSQNENNVFAQLENATAKRTEDLQKQRTQDAINRHRQVSVLSSFFIVESLDHSLIIIVFFPIILVH